MDLFLGDHTQRKTQTRFRKHDYLSLGSSQKHVLYSSICLTISLSTLSYHENLHLSIFRFLVSQFSSFPDSLSFFLDPISFLLLLNMERPWAKQEKILGVLYLKIAELYRGGISMAVSYREGARA